jgi:hypothetical protein
METKRILGDLNFVSGLALHVTQQCRIRRNLNTSKQFGIVLRTIVCDMQTHRMCVERERGEKREKLHLDVAVENGTVQSASQPTLHNMGISFSSLLSHYFGSSEVRILMVREG